MIYAAAWEGKPFAIYATRPGSPESSPLDLPGGSILAISPRGHLALQTEQARRRALRLLRHARGSAPHGRRSAARAPSRRAVGRLVARRQASRDRARRGGRNRLESPVGTVLYETAGWIGHPRFSPRGDAIALLDHWARVGDLGTVVLVTLSGKATTLSEGWTSIQGLAWRPDGKEIWFTGTKVGGNRSLCAVDRSGRERLVFRQTGSLRLEDISRAGDMLFSRRKSASGSSAARRGRQKERDLSWLDFSALRDFSADGKKILFDESAEAGGAEGTVFLRDTDGSAPVRLGPGFGMGLSPDERLVVSSISNNPRKRAPSAGRRGRASPDRRTAVSARVGGLVARRKRSPSLRRREPATATGCTCSESREECRAP